MRNNRGQIFAGFLVLITLFMCGVVIMLYWVQQGNADSSLVSPRAVLEMRDNLEIFEIREMALVEDSIKNIDTEFGSDDFIREFRDRFLDGVIADDEMSEFIFSGSVFNEYAFNFDSQRDRRDFLDNNLYSGVVDVDGKLVFSRNTMGKRILLEADDNSKINFPVWFEYDFTKEYSISENKEGVE